MKCLLLLFVAIAVCTASVVKDPIQGYKEGDRFFYFAGDDGIVRLVDADEPVDFDFIEEYTRNPANNAYWLYTRANPTTAQVLVHGDLQSVLSSYHDRSKVTVFLAHGWNGDGNNHMNKLLTEAFLIKDDVNVIVLDWSRLANRSYTTAKGGTAAVGRGLGQFVSWFVGNGFASYNRVHLVGFSLGGHLVANAGRETGSAVARVTSLDPAGPLWNWDSDRVKPTDAHYVEVIHTNTGFLGYTDPCGDADFYPNGGSSMPGCFWSSCSHGRAFEYMASSVKHNHFLANQCATYREASRDRCTGALEPMGNSDLIKPGRGIFRVNTARNYPY